MIPQPGGKGREKGSKDELSEFFNRFIGCFGGAGDALKPVQAEEENGRLNGFERAQNRRNGSAAQ